MGQLKQNVTGYYGVGIALRLFWSAKIRSCLPSKAIPKSLFFKISINNCEMAMKMFLPTYWIPGAGPTLRRDMEHDPIRNMNWPEIYPANLRQQRTDGRLPVELLSIQMRERIVLPLTTIQQYAMAHARSGRTICQAQHEIFWETGNAIVLFGIINAGRNSA